MNNLRQKVSAVVSTSWLADTLAGNKSNFRLLDGSWHLPTKNRDPISEFYAKHIPGAQLFDHDECCDKSVSLPHMIPQAEQFEKYVGNLGINNSTHVVIYDNNEDFGLFSAQRVWWTFRAFGHTTVSVLDGGLQKWEKEGRETTEIVEKVPCEKFKANFVPHLVKKFDDVMNNIHNPSFTLLDARPAGRFQGTAPEPRPDIESGHIPGSVNIPFIDLLDRKNGTLKSKEELRQIFESAKVNLNSDLVGSCGSGMSATLLALSAYILGKDDFAIYDGSWTEWYEKSNPRYRIKSS